MRVAELVDRTMHRVRERTGTVDTLDVAVLAALNIASDLLAARRSQPAASAHGEPASEADPESARMSDGLSIEPQRVRDLVDLIDSLEQV